MRSWIIFNLWIPMASASPMWGTLYPLGSDHSKVLYEFKASDDQVNGGRILHTTFTAPDGTVAVKEEIIFKNNRWSEYNVEQLQLEEKYHLQIMGEQVIFEKVHNQDHERNIEKLTGNLVIGPTLVDYIQVHWNELAAHQEVKIRFAVPERKETVEFKLELQEEKKVGDTYSIKMSPASFLLTLVVPSVFVKLDRQSRQLRAVIGRTLPKLRKGTMWRDLDVDGIYRGTP